MFADTYARIKRNALSEYHYQHYIYIFEYQYVVRAVPTPFNLPLLLWDSCKACCMSRAERRNRARMNLDDGYDEDPHYGAPPGVDRDEGLSLMRKYVARYLQNNTELSSATTLTNLARRIEGNVSEMEERVMHEFEHIHNSLIAPMGSGAKLEMRLQMIGQALDRVLRGQGQHEAAAALNGGQVKEKVKRHVEEPVMMAPSTAAAPAPMAVAAAASGGGVKQGTASPSKRKDW